MRITLLLNWDSASAYALSLLKDDLDNFDVAVFYTCKTSKSKTTPKALTALARFDGEKLLQWHSIFEHFNAQPLNDINGQGFTEFTQTKPDLVICIRHMSILKSKIINTPKHGVINLHSGLLPSYQGVMATFWAMKNKEVNIGTTLHFIEDARIDSGGIICLSPQITQFDKSYFDNMLSVYQQGCAAIINAANTLNEGKALLAAPQSGEANYFTYPTKADLDEFEYLLF